MSGETRREAKRMARKARLSERATLSTNAQESEAHRVYLWRLESLEAAGMPKALAKLVADSSFDLRKAEEMLADGCSPELLLKIAL